MSFIHCIGCKYLFVGQSNIHDGCKLDWDATTVMTRLRTINTGDYNAARKAVIVNTGDCCKWEEKL